MDVTCYAMECEVPKKNLEPIWGGNPKPNRKLRKKHIFWEEMLKYIMDIHVIFQYIPSIHWVNTFFEAKKGGHWL